MILRVVHFAQQGTRRTSVQVPTSSWRRKVLQQPWIGQPITIVLRVSMVLRMPCHRLCPSVHGDSDRVPSQLRACAESANSRVEVHHLGGGPRAKLGPLSKDFFKCSSTHGKTTRIKARTPPEVGGPNSINDGDTHRSSTVAPFLCASTFHPHPQALPRSRIALSASQYPSCRPCSADPISILGAPQVATVDVGKQLSKQIQRGDDVVDL